MQRRLEYATLILAFAIVGAAALFPLQDYDIMWQMAVGRLIWADGLPHADPFSYLTGGRPWIAEYWLYQVLVYLLYRVGGYSIFVWLRLVLVVGLFALWWVALRRRYPAGLIAGQFLISLMFLYHRLLMRPELVTFLFFSLSYILLDRARTWSYQRIAATFLVLQAAWANLHQAFMLGTMLAAFFTMEAAAAWALAAWKRHSRAAETATLLRYALALGIGAVGCFLNPYGAAYVFHTLGVVHSKTQLTFLYEWKPLFYFPHILFRPWFVVFYILSVAMLAACGRKGRPVHWLLLLVLGWQAWHTWRIVGLLGIALIPVNCESAALLMSKMERWPNTIRRFVCTPALAMGLLSLLVAAEVALLVGLVSGAFYRRFDPMRTFGLGMRPDSYPIASAERLRAMDVRGNLLNSFAYGGYLMWTLGDTCKVGTDGRGQIYPLDVITSYLALTEGRGDFDGFVRKHAITACVLDMQWPGLINRLLRDRKNWALVAIGREDVAFVRRDAVSTATLERFEILPQALDGYVLSTQSVRPPLPAAYGYRLALFVEAGRHDLALRQMDEMEKAGGDRTLALVARGQLMMQLGRPQEAEQYFSKAIEQNPRNFEASLALALLQFNRRDWKSALVHAERAAALRPREAAALHVLGRCRAAVGNLDGAVEAFERATRRQPENPALWYDLGRIHLDRKDDAAAQRALERALALEPSSRAVMELLAGSYEQTNRIADAAALLRELVKVDTENLRLRQRLRRLEKLLEEKKTK
ncbi:MAG: tetratricopeptide repeat protein [Candidatus Sumerlaeia bacterium]|nr:tetratricopeptide repeat protein [Candidatus Sumerlaeia bacterium]